MDVGQKIVAARAAAILTTVANMGERQVERVDYEELSDAGSEVLRRIVIGTG